LILEAFDFTLGLAFLETDRTNMLVVERDIAQSTQKSSAGRAGYDSLFAGMIEAAGLFVHLQGCSSLPYRQRPVNGRVCIGPQKTAAGSAGNQRLGIDGRRSQRSVAARAVDHDISLI
jgi:hypothetical protein